MVKTLMMALPKNLANLEKKMEVLGDAYVATEQELEQSASSKNEVATGAAQAQALKERVDHTTIYKTFIDGDIPPIKV